MLLKCKMLISMFDHRETCRATCCHAYRTEHLTGNWSFTTLDGWGGERILFLRDYRIFWTNLSPKNTIWTLNAWHSKVFKIFYPWYLSYRWHDYVEVQFYFRSKCYFPLFSNTVQHLIYINNPQNKGKWNLSQNFNRQPKHLHWQFLANWLNVEII